MNEGRKTCVNLCLCIMQSFRDGLGGPQEGVIGRRKQSPAVNKNVGEHVWAILSAVRRKGFTVKGLFCRGRNGRDKEEKARQGGSVAPQK